MRRNGNQVMEEGGWAGVRVLRAAGDRFRPSAVHGCTFGGRVVLGGVGDASAPQLEVDGVSFRSGLQHSTIVDSTVLDGALVARTALLSRCVVGERGCVVGCGSVICRLPGSRFGNGRSLKVVVETGGRETPIFAEMTFEGAAALAGDRSDPAALARAAALVEEYAGRASAGWTLVCSDATVLNCPRVEDAFIGAGALVEGSRVIDTTVLSAPGPGPGRAVIRGGALLEHSLVQWGCRCDSMAVVSGSLLCATATVARHAKVVDSVLAPCSGAAEGEITASVVGPFVGFHHQSLLIACYWPAGRGNVGHGANVGSNHTGKAPDQELWPGEGMFFGLATSIKYPSNFVRSPYSLVATGVSTLPQRLEMPFSLINSPSRHVDGLSPALNEIMPGWVLSDNLYMVLRGERKFWERGAAPRELPPGQGQVHYGHEALRPATVLMMLEAKARLEGAAPDPAAAAAAAATGTGTGTAVYTDGDVPGLGKNYMTESSRARGIEAYRTMARFYALRVLWRAVEAGEPAPALVASLRAPGCRRAAAEWARATDSPSGAVRPGSPGPAADEWRRFACGVLHDDLGPAPGLPELLQLYARTFVDLADAVLQSKQKDDKRGSRVIDDYGAAHGEAAATDPVVAAVTAESRRTATSIARYLNGCAADSAAAAAGATVGLQFAKL